MAKITNYIIVGLGNPDLEYKETRHNLGRMVLDAFLKADDFSDWQMDKKLKASTSLGRIGKTKIFLVKPETFMNKSGLSVKPLIKSLKVAETLIVIHDDLDIPFGSYKISFNKSSGGHKGVESIIRAIKTEGFVRIRVGILPLSVSGKPMKPKGDEAVGKFILGKFKPAESVILKKLFKKISESLTIIVTEGREKAMSVQK